MVLLLARNINIEENICDQLFNHSEKRLARILLKLGRIQEQDVQQNAVIPKMRYTRLLFEMVGTTRSRITIFMNKFKTMGLIDYSGHGHHRTVKTDLLMKMVACSWRRVLHSSPLSICPHARSMVISLRRHLRAFCETLSFESRFVQLETLFG